jgi:molybdopterin synthase sulfur carrier subunit
MITVIFLASLREAMGLEGCEVEHAPTIAEVWAQATDASPVQTSILCAINGDLANWHAKVSDGDEVAFFPPMTGG